MKKQTTNQFMPLSAKDREQLTTVVNETVAMEHHQAKSLSSADLWNIQRRSRTMMQRRHYV
jgi:hypothetical protein